MRGFSPEYMGSHAIIAKRALSGNVGSKCGDAKDSFIVADEVIYHYVLYGEGGNRRGLVVANDPREVVTSVGYVNIHGTTEEPGKNSSREYVLLNDGRVVLFEHLVFDDGPQRDIRYVEPEELLNILREIEEQITA